MRGKDKNHSVRKKRFRKIVVLRESSGIELNHLCSASFSQSPNNSGTCTWTTLAEPQYIFFIS